MGLAQRRTCQPRSCATVRKDCGEQADRGRKALIRQHAPHAKDFTNQPYRYRGIVDELERGKNRTKSSVRANVEHPFRMIKQVFGFVKVRYRGLVKTTERVRVTCGLTSLFMVERRCCAPDRRSVPQMLLRG